MPTGQITKNPEIRVGGLFALTGPGASWGHEEMLAVKLAFDDTQLKLIIEDTETQQKRTVTAALKLIDSDHVQVIIGPTWDESTAAVAPVVEEQKVVLISPSISGAVEEEREFSYLFTTWYSDISATKTVQRFMARQNHKKIAIVYTLNTWPQFTRNIFIQGAPEYNIQVIKEFPIIDEVHDYRTILLKLKSLQIDAVYFAFTSDESIEPFLKQAKELQLHVPLYSASQTENEQTVVWYGWHTIYHPYPKTTSKLAQFNEKFKAKYGKKPVSPSAATAYDAGRLIAAALKSGARTGPEIRDWLDNLNNFPGTIVDTITFDEKGLLDAGPDAFVIKTVVDQEFVEI